MKSLRNLTDVELLQELEQLNIVDRKADCAVNLELFIDEYVPHLAPVARPPFHRELLGILQRSAYNGSDKPNERSHNYIYANLQDDLKKKRGGSDPHPPTDINTITGRQNSAKKTKSLDKTPAQLSPSPNADSSTASKDNLQR